LFLEPEDEDAIVTQATAVDTGTHGAGSDTEEADFNEDINLDHDEAFCRSAL
jgi:hypothetical protein